MYICIHSQPQGTEKSTACALESVLQLSVLAYYSTATAAPKIARRNRLI